MLESDTLPRSAVHSIIPAAPEVLAATLTDICSTFWVRVAPMQVFTACNGTGFRKRAGGFNRHIFSGGGGGGIMEAAGL